MSCALANLLVSGDQERGSLSMSMNSHLLLMKCIGPENQIGWIGQFPFYDVCFLLKLGSKLEFDVIPGERSQSDITLSALVVLSSDKATPRVVCASGNAVTLGRWIPTHF